MENCILHTCNVCFLQKPPFYGVISSFRVRLWIRNAGIGRAVLHLLRAYTVADGGGPRRSLVPIQHDNNTTVNNGELSKSVTYACNG